MNRHINLTYFGNYVPSGWARKMISEDGFESETGFRGQWRENMDKIQNRFWFHVPVKCTFNINLYFWLLAEICYMAYWYYSQVHMIGDGTADPVVIAGDKLGDQKELENIASSLALPTSIQTTRASLGEKLFEWVVFDNNYNTSSKDKFTECIIQNGINIKIL